MRFLFAVIADNSKEVAATANERLAINEFNEKLEAGGHRVMAAGVAAPSSATLFDNRNGRGRVTTGPAVDSELFMAGFWVIEAADDSVAHSLAAEASLACNRLIEVRRFL